MVRTESARWGLGRLPPCRGVRRQHDLCGAGLHPPDSNLHAQIHCGDPSMRVAITKRLEQALGLSEAGWPWVTSVVINFQV